MSRLETWLASKGVYPSGFETEDLEEARTKAREYRNNKFQTTIVINYTDEKVKIYRVFASLLSA